MKGDYTGDNTHSAHWGAFRTRVENGRLTGVTPFEKDLDASPILDSIPDAVHSEARIEQPMVRKGWLEHGPGGNREARGGEPFVPVSWERALGLVADELERVRSAHGNAAIYGGSYGWASAGRFHHAPTQLQRFLNTIGGFTDDIHNYSVAAGLAILPHVVGGSREFINKSSSWDGLVRHTRLMVLFGGLPMRNLQVAPGGIAQHTSSSYLKKLKQAGAAFVNISPARADAADFLEAEWLPIRPNTDTALMLALAHTLATEGLHDTAFLARCCEGYALFEEYLLGHGKARDGGGHPKDAEWAAAITGIAAGSIRALARRMAAERTLINTNYALQRGDHGEQPFWMTVVLAAMLGQIGLPGGGFAFALGSMGNRGAPRQGIPSPALPTGANPVDSWIPVARIADMLLHPGETYAFNGEQRVYPDIHLVYWCGGNPFHAHQDINQLIRAWKRPETVIVHDPWWTATARHADIVLPATTTLERNDLGACSDDRFIMAMKQAIPPVGGARNDHDICADLAEIFGKRQAFSEGRGELDWVRLLYDDTRQKSATRGVELPTFETFWERGYVEIPPPDAPFVALEAFRGDPGRHRLDTPSGKIEIFSETIAGFGYEDCPGHPVWLEPAEWLGGEGVQHYPLHLLSCQPATRLHSQMDPGRYSRDSKIQGREPIRMNPGDANARGIVDGDVVRVFNGRGALLAGVTLDEGLLPQVVVLPTGAWYDPADPAGENSLEKHGNPNVLTLDKGTSKLGQGPIAQTTLVEMEKYEGELPEITAFVPPPKENPQENPKESPKEEKSP